MPVFASSPTCTVINRILKMQKTKFYDILERKCRILWVRKQVISSWTLCETMAMGERDPANNFFIKKLFHLQIKVKAITGHKTMNGKNRSPKRVA